jgi:hypothetical protein
MREGNPHSSIGDDCVLPDQLRGRGVGSRGGEFGLLWAVFSDGIRTYCEAVLDGSTSSFTYREVHCWIFREGSEEGITSFAGLCELFGLDPRSMRRALLRFREHPSAEVLEVFTIKVA